MQKRKAKEEEAQNKEDADATAGGFGAGGFGAAGFGASPLLTPTRQKGGRMQETTSPNKKLPGSPQKLFILESETEAHLLKKRRPSFRGSLLTETKVIDAIGAILEKKARADTIRVSDIRRPRRVWRPASGQVYPIVITIQSAKGLSALALPRSCLGLSSELLHRRPWPNARRAGCCRIHCRRRTCSPEQGGQRRLGLEPKWTAADSGTQVRCRTRGRPSPAR